MSRPTSLETAENAEAHITDQATEETILDPPTSKQDKTMRENRTPAIKSQIEDASRGATSHVKEAHPRRNETLKHANGKFIKEKVGSQIGATRLLGSRFEAKSTDIQ
ncbi:hypothetical protein ABW19_dt0203907 [Dactylella cylindrospora]|nr:hypothetical protein ABW19_dt0203907 [Dactylella cylindrospora]